MIYHYLDPQGREDVTKFIRILENRHLVEGGPLMKTMAMRPGEVFEYEGREA